MTPPKRTASGLFVVQAALMRPELTKADALVLAVLIEYVSGQYGYAWAAVETIMRVANRDRRTVQRALRRLEAAKIIGTEPGNGRNKTSRYYVRVDAFPRSPLAGPIKEVAAQRARERASLRDEKGGSHAALPDGEKAAATPPLRPEKAAAVSETGGSHAAQTAMTNLHDQAKPTLSGGGYAALPDRRSTFVEAPPAVDLDDAELREVLAALERSLARGELPSPLWAEDWIEWLKHVARVHPGTADAIGARAERMVNDLYAMLPEDALQPAPPLHTTGTTERLKAGPDHTGSARLKNSQRYQPSRVQAAEVLAEMEAALDRNEVSASLAEAYLDRLEAISEFDIQHDGRVALVCNRLYAILDARYAQKPDTQGGEPCDEDVDAAERAAIQEIDGRSGPAPSDRGVTWDDL